MNSLIPISSGTIAGEALSTINARDLHRFLEVQTAFKDWIVRRIEEYGFEEGQDFCSILSKSSGGRPAKDYHLSLDMAKELAMVEKTPKGREARRYFIECERRAKALASGAAAAPASPHPVEHHLLDLEADLFRLQATSKQFEGMASAFAALTSPQNEDRASRALAMALQTMARAPPGYWPGCIRI